MTKVFIGGCSGSIVPPARRLVCDRQTGQAGYASLQRDRYGHATTSFAIVTGRTGLLVDNGSGSVEAGNFLLRINVEVVTLLQTHYHADHMEGLPYNPLLCGSKPLGGLYGPALVMGGAEGACEARLNFGNHPRLPLELAVQSFRPGTILNPGVLVGTMSLCHPGGALAYRIETPDGAIVIATDHELLPDQEQRYADFCSGAALLIAETQYWEAEYRGERPVCGAGTAISRRGWGHATPEMLAAALSRCNRPPRQIVTIHHDPLRDDENIEDLTEYLASLLPDVSVVAGAEGDIYSL